MGARVMAVDAGVTSVRVLRPGDRLAHYTVVSVLGSALPTPEEPIDEDGEGNGDGGDEGGGPPPHSNSGGKGNGND